MSEKKAPFITFEGGEGSGKSSQSSRLVALINEQGAAQAVHTRDPGGCASAAEIRQLLVTGAVDRWTKGADMLLYTAARVELVEGVIWPALSSGAAVICDRFIDSTLAYQANGDAAKEEIVLSLHNSFCRNLFPDLTIILDVDPEIGLARSKRRLASESSDEGRFEAMKLDFHRRLRSVFLANAVKEPNRYLVIDATKTPDEIFAIITAAVGSRFPQLLGDNSQAA